MVIFDGVSLIVVFALVIASIVDIRIREVPDVLSYCLFAFGIIHSLFLSAYFYDYMFFVSGIFGFLFALVFSLLFYYTGQWGGGDAKLLMALGFLFGVDLFRLRFFDNFFISFFISIFLVGALWGLIWSFFLVFKNFKVFLRGYANFTKSSKLYSFKNWFLGAFVFFILIVFFLGLGLFFKVILWSLLLFCMLYFYLYFFSKVVEKYCMVKRIPVNSLVEGDWIVGKVKLKNGKFFSSSKTGLEKKDIFLLKKNVDFVDVREGVPFVPSFLFAYLICLFFGAWLSLFF
ncbi:A24 family peptidase [Candidatus Woesearchaeota archaeon]|nr:A24 family peptidase [Candidatus Woesearchaeota archaeon]